MKAASDAAVTVRDVFFGRTIEEAVAGCLVHASGNSLSPEDALGQARQMLEDAREQASLRREATRHRRGR